LEIDTGAWAGLATIADKAALGGRMRAAKLNKEELSRIGRKGGKAKARKRKAMLQTFDKWDRANERDKKELRCRSRNSQ
jgi:general stress protein YciG